MNKINATCCFVIILSIVSLILLLPDKQHSLQIKDSVAREKTISSFDIQTTISIAEDSNTTLSAELTKKILNQNLTLAERYLACQSFRQTLLNTLNKGMEPNIDFHDHMLLVCRKVSNQQLVSEEQLLQWQLLKIMVREEGHERLLSMLRSGEISPDFAIQHANPKMNLLFLIGTIVEDVNVYRQLINMGVEVNSFFLDAALLSGNIELVKLYTEYAGFNNTDDMLVRPFYQAARVGNIEAMIWLAEQGALLDDPLGRDPLLALLHRAPLELTAESLSHLLAATGLQLNATHVAAAHQQKARLSGEVRGLIESLAAE